MQQRTAEWHAARLGCITSSRVAPVMSTGRSKSEPWSQAAKALAMQLLAETWTGQPRLVPTTKAMQWGIDHEDEARRVYEQRRGVIVDQAGWVPHRREPFVGCSPDGFVGLGGLVEIKCPEDSARHLAVIATGEIDKDYRHQMQHQLWCTGRSWCDYVSYDPRQPVGMNMCVIRVAADWQPLAERVVAFRDMMLSINRRLKEFWREQTTSIGAAIADGAAAGTAAD